jgi:hypothetical protein
MIFGDFEILELEGQRPSQRSNYDMHCHCMLYLGATLSSPHHASVSKLDRSGSNSRKQKRKATHTIGCKMCSDNDMSWWGQIETAIWGRSSFPTLNTCVNLSTIICSEVLCRCYSGYTFTRSKHQTRYSDTIGALAFCVWSSRVIGNG